MLKRSRTDDSADESGAPRRLLIAAADEQARRTYASLLGTRGFETVTSPLNAAATAANETHVACAVIVGTGVEENGAIKQVDDMRNSANQQVRRTAALLLVSSVRNQIFAWESGIDGLVIVPAHLDAIAAAIEEILARPRLERHGHRQLQLAALRDD